jgi:hypothetical protein
MFRATRSENNHLRPLFRVVCEGGFESLMFSNVAKFNEFC